jgi:type IV fimbrial biogenesis protein FimT
MDVTKHDPHSTRPERLRQSFSDITTMPRTRIARETDPARRDRAHLHATRSRAQTLHLSGFTLLELMLTLTVLAVLVTLGMPSMQELLARNRLKTAAHALVGDMQWTRGEAIRRNLDLYLTIDTGTWCYGVSVIDACDCRLTDPRAAKACTLPTAGEPILKTVSGVDFPSVRVASISFAGAPPQTRFEPRRATANAGSLTFKSEQGPELRIVLSMLGRVRVCSPKAFSIPGYPAC